MNKSFSYRCVPHSVLSYLTFNASITSVKIRKWFRGIFWHSYWNDVYNALLNIWMDSIAPHHLCNTVRVSGLCVLIRYNHATMFDLYLSAVVYTVFVIDSSMWYYVCFMHNFHSKKSDQAPLSKVNLTKKESTFSTRVGMNFVYRTCYWRYVDNDTSSFSVIHVI